MYTNIGCFVAGWLSAILGVAAFGLWALKREKKREQRKLEANLAAQKADLEKMKSADARLQRASEITRQQDQIDLNSGNTESLIHFNNLEVEKISILKSIIKDGYNPVVVVKSGAENKQMLLSNYIASLQKTLH